MIARRRTFIRLLTMKDLRDVKGIDYSRAQIYRLMNDGKFPHSIAIGANRIEFLEPEIDRWIRSKKLERDAKLRAMGRRDKTDPDTDI